MKLVFFGVLVLFVTATNLTNAESLFGFGFDGQLPFGIGDGFGDILHDFSDGINDFGKNIADNIKNAIDTGKASFEDFAGIVANATQAMIEESIANAEKVANGFLTLAERNFQNFISSIQALRLTIDEAMKRISSPVKRGVLAQVQRQMAKIQESSEKLKQRINEVEQKWKDNVAEGNSIISDKFNQWAEGQMESISVAAGDRQEVYDEAEDVLNEFINRYSAYINNCADELDNALDGYQDRAQNSISKYQDGLSSLVQALSSCVERTASDSQCRSDATRQLRKLSGAPREFASLIAEGGKLLKEDFLSRTCVVKTLAQFESEKSNVRSKIADILSKGTEDDNGDQSSENDTDENESTK